LKVIIATLIKFVQLRSIAYIILACCRRIQSNIVHLACKKYVQCGRNSFFYETAKVVNIQRNPNAIKIGALFSIRGELVVLTHGGNISIGDYCFIGENSRLWSGKSICIGNRVLISHGVNIHDTNAHPIDMADRHERYKHISTSGDPKQIALNEVPIIIEDDAWIGFNVTILKGVKIGRGAIVAAGSIVTKDVEPFSIVAGVPAKFVKKITNES